MAKKLIRVAKKLIRPDQAAMRAGNRLAFGRKVNLAKARVAVGRPAIRGIRTKVEAPWERLNRLDGRVLEEKIEARQVRRRSVITRGGPVFVLPGSERILPHTLVDRHGRRVQTQKWINRAFLVVVEDDQQRIIRLSGGFGPVDTSRAMLGLAGPKFRCYYPGSSKRDYDAVIGSGSSGRWLQRWPQKSLYVSF